MQKRLGVFSSGLLLSVCVLACQGSVEEIARPKKRAATAGSPASSELATPAGTGSSLQSPVNSQGGPAAFEPDAGGPSSPLESTTEVPLPMSTNVYFEPSGGTFVRSATVRLRADDPLDKIYYTLDGSIPDEMSALFSEAIELTKSTIVRAFVVSDALGRGETDAASFTRIDEQLAAFSSDLPLLLLHSEAPAPKKAAGGADAERGLVGVNVYPLDNSGRSSLTVLPQVSARAGLKLRGSSSSGFAKSPYSLEYWSGAEDDDSETPMLDLAKESDWVLTPPYKTDPALIRDALVYALSNSIGRYAPHTRFVELFLADNGEVAGMQHYRGVYVLTEKIKRDGARLDLAVLDSSMGQLPEVSGGYIFKLDRLGEGEHGFVAGKAGDTYSLRPMAFVYPKEENVSAAQKAFLIDYVDECAEALASDNYRSPGSGRHYSELLDVPSFIDHHILSVLTKNPDALRLSSYLHKDRLGKLQAGPVWDFDRAMNAASDSRAAEPTWWDNTGVTDDTTAVFDFGWWRSLFDDPEFASAYWARLKVLLAGPLSETAIVETIDALSAQVAEAAPRNYERWPEAAPRGGSQQSEAKLLKAWFKTRLPWMAQCLELPDPETCEGAPQQFRP